MLEREHFVTCEKFVDFLGRYSRALSGQLAGVEKTVEGAITEIMESIKSMSDQTGHYKAQADTVLEEVYLNPSKETVELVSAVQGSVDELISSLQGGGGVGGSESENADGTSVRRLASHFSKRMESMSTLDDALSSLFTAMMGALSNGDVIFQRIEHIGRSLNALNLGLAYLLVDVNGRFNLAGVQKLKNDLLEYTMRQYGSEEERHIHKAICTDEAA